MRQHNDAETASHVLQSVPAEVVARIEYEDNAGHAVQTSVQVVSASSAQLSLAPKVDAGNTASTEAKRTEQC